MTTQFLECGSQEEIKKFKPIFDQAVEEAKKIAEKAGVTFFDIVEVRFYTSDEESKEGNGCKWIPNDEAKTAVIKFSRNADLEALTHEVGHSFFHPSPLHERYNEGAQYGEKFCNAFRYALHPDKGKCWMATDGGSYDAHRLIKKCETLPEGKLGDLLAALSKYFADLCEKKRAKICEQKKKGAKDPERILDSEDI